MTIPNLNTPLRKALLCNRAAMRFAPHAEHLCQNEASGEVGAMRNLITDVPGLAVGHADDAAAATGVTTIVFPEETTASASVQGGAPGGRDTALLEPEMVRQTIDAVVLSGGSLFGLDAAGGVVNALARMGRGFGIGGVKVPIASQAILFDLINGGAKPWLTSPSTSRPPYWDLGLAAAQSAAADFALGSVGAGLGATTVNLKGGIGSASSVTPSGHIVGALVAVNAVGSATIGEGPHFWAAACERGSEFGGRGWPARIPPEALALRFKGGAPPSTSIGLVATDARLTKSECKRVAIMAHDGLARALRPVHAPMDGDTLFVAATGASERAVDPVMLTEIGSAAADCVARAVARGVFEARALPFAGALPSWQDVFGATAPAARSRTMEEAVQVTAPDGATVHILGRLDTASFARFSLKAGETSRAVVHRTVDEIWHVTDGAGEMWLKAADAEQVVLLKPGTCITIPVGTAFQFRANHADGVAAVAATMPPWPEAREEAIRVPGPWKETR
jgi:D-aminopeptidase